MPRFWRRLHKANGALKKFFQPLQSAAAVRRFYQPAKISPHHELLIALVRIPINRRPWWTMVHGYDALGRWVGAW
jgi:hypothetical protein